MFQLRHETRITPGTALASGFRLLALLGFGLYAAWNVWFLARLHLPPSIWMAATGLPCASTGCTRSLLAALHGHWAESLGFNPFTFPFIALLAASGVALGKQALSGRKLALPPLLVIGWAVCLSVAWIVQIARA